jgi:2-amino-4-hydroxy-6-hydroxymethyldihydropteridine diphosphokinase
MPGPGKRKLNRAFIGLGANLGERETQIRSALERLNATPGISVAKVSKLIETDPVGGPPGQPKYLNGAACLRTTLAPRQLLERLLEIEKELGRDRSGKKLNAPRLIDLDLLLYEGQTLAEPGLVVPHPRMAEREFVLRPLCEIAPQAVHPLLKKTAREMLAAFSRYLAPDGAKYFAAPRLAPKLSRTR